LQRLVEDLRTMSLADAGELNLNRQAIAPRELLNLAAAAFSHQAEQQQIRLVVIAPSILPLLNVDPDRILQVLSNLLSNALRHTPTQGQITLSASSPSEHNIILSVQDTGTGIAPEHLPHIFERFYSADGSHSQIQGESGLGLAIAKSLIEAHGGTIIATSPGGSGTKMTMVFKVIG
jgi:two-component system, OmpR family, sensor histidine kinase BaeS